MLDGGDEVPPLGRLLKWNAGAGGWRVYECLFQLGSAIHIFDGVVLT